MRIDFNVGDSNCMRNDLDVCESTKIVSAKRPRCMRTDLYAKRPTSSLHTTALRSYFCCTEFLFKNPTSSFKVMKPSNITFVIFNLFTACPFYILFHNATNISFLAIYRAGALLVPFFESAQKIVSRIVTKLVLETDSGIYFVSGPYQIHHVIRLHLISSP